MISVNRNNSPSRIVVELVSCLAVLLLAGGLAHGQGGTGKGASAPAKTTSPAKPATGRGVAVASIEGTTWSFEGREGGKFLGKGVFEFLAGGKLLISGDSFDEFKWKQNGGRLSIDGYDPKGEKGAHFSGTISGNQINGTWTARERGGPLKKMEFRARRGDAELLAELEYWKSIKDSTNADDFKAYLEKYPYGVFVADAVGRMRRLEATKSASPSPTP